MSNAQDRLRLQLLNAVEGLSESDLLRLAVQHAVAAVSGLGAFAHLAEPEERALRLVAAAGWPTHIARLWERLPLDSPVAPVQAMSENRRVWRKTWPAPFEDQEPTHQATAQWQTTGVLSAPLLVDGVPVGALSVLCQDSPAHGESLTMLAEFVSRRLGHAPVAHTGRAPWWQEQPVPKRGSAVRAVRVARWEWKLATGILHIDEVGEDLLQLAGLDPQTWDGRIDSWMARIHPDDRPNVDAEVTRAMRDGDLFAVEYRVVDLTGQPNWLELRGQFTYAQDGTPLTMAGTGWDVTDLRSKLEWLTSLLELHPDPVYVFRADARVAWANRTARRLSAVRGIEELVGTIPWVADDSLAGTGLPEMIARARAADGSAVTHEFTVPGDERFGPASYTSRAVAIGEHIAVQLVDVTEQKRAEERAAERAERVEELRGAMALALGARDIAGAIERNMLPLIEASGLLVYQYTQGLPYLVGTAGYSAKFLGILHDQNSVRQLESLPGSDSPQFISDPAEFGRLYPHLLELARLGGKKSWALLPLTVAGVRVGHCIISWDEPRVLDIEERALLTTLSGLMAQALERGKLYDVEHSRAQELRRAVRPRELPPLTSVTVAVRHLPANEEETGGTWCDAISLPGARVALISGAVQGGGLRAAITMAQLRSIVAELTALDYPLSELIVRISDSDIVTHLTQMEDETHPALLIALYDATTGRLEMTSAGHPAPLVTFPGRSPEVGHLAVGASLGTSPLPYDSVDLDVPVGTIVGLGTELTSDSADEETARLLERASVSRAASGELERACDRIVRRIAPEGHEDAALLLARLDRVAAERIAEWRLPWDPRSAGQARELAQGQLADWGLSDIEFASELAISELIGNTVRHATGPVRLRLLHLENALHIEVYDGSQSMPHMQPMQLMAEHGRGLLMIGQIAASWGSRFTEDGKCIWVVLDTSAE